MDEYTTSDIDMVDDVDVDDGLLQNDAEDYELPEWPFDSKFDDDICEVSATDQLLFDLPQSCDLETLKDISDIHNISDWIGDINPNYDPFDIESPYLSNCGSCAYAVFQRLEGDNDACAAEDNIGFNYQMNALTGMEQVSMTPDEIEAALLEAGDGSHAIIGIDRAEGPGHWFNAACIDGQVIAIDGQSGEISRWPPDYGDVVNWEMSVRRDQDER